MGGLLGWLKRRRARAKINNDANQIFGHGKWTERKRGQTYAHQHESVTCANGHVIGTFLKSVRVGDPFDPTAIGNWRQTAPTIGLVPPPCEICGAEWTRGSCTYHFFDGWRIVI